MSSGKVVLALLAGVASGAVLVLFAPERARYAKKLSGEGSNFKNQ
jgi:hypothetical protein